MCSGGKLKPSKKKQFGGLKMSSSNRTQPVVRIIRQYANKDNAPVDYHSVQHTGVLLAPAAERDWRSYRYASKCRIGRGGRVIFDRNQVKDKVPMKIFYGVDHLDWDTTRYCSHTFSCCLLLFSHNRLLVCCCCCCCCCCSASEKPCEFGLSQLTQWHNS